MTATSAGRPATGVAHSPLPKPPDDKQKYSYIRRYLPYLTIVVTVGYSSIILSQAVMEVRYRVWVLMPWTAFTVIYMLISLTTNFVGRDFDISRHRDRVKRWRPRRYPDVDIYLPICGEPIDVLHNTWTYVFELLRAYPGYAVAYVLDDGGDRAARRLAKDFGFVYASRPNRGWMKKAGNLRYAFANTSAEFFVILDADFVPRSDFLAETLPYFDERDVAIVQTPQFFDTGRCENWLERSAGAMQEVFYRSMQVSRDSFGAAVCVGSCAVYRRAALEPVGGPALIAYAEDVHTGLDAISQGWRVIYVPVNVATGASPTTVDAFAHQQYRWCLGSTTPLRRLWSVPMGTRARLAFLSGFLYYLFTAILLFVVPAVAMGMLIFLPQDIHLQDYIVLAPALINGIVLYPTWHRTDFGFGTWPLEVVRAWSHALAIWDHFRGKVMAWQPTGGSVSPVRRLWGGLIFWNGGTSLAWFAVAGWRTWEFRSDRFLVMMGFGVLYAAPIAWIFATRRRRQR